MRYGKRIILIFLSILVFQILLQAKEECTTAVFAGKATVDGRPLLWKNRDTSEENNEVVFIPGGVYDVLALISAGQTTSVWMGINSMGFAIENSLSSDLEGSSSGENGSFMKQALQNCATVEDFELLLISTNSSGRLTKSNYGVIDATGAAAIFETGNHMYTKYDANNPGTAPDGFIVRTNFAKTGNGTGGGHTRYYRAIDLFKKRLLNSKVSHEYILKSVSRDLKNDQIDPYPLPYPGSQDSRPAGYIHTNYSINRHKTRSSVVFQGVLPGEDAWLSTMWVSLGEPGCGITVPLWTFAGATPHEMNGALTAPMCDASIAKDKFCYPLKTSPEYINTFTLDDGVGSGLFSYIRPIEDWIFANTAAAKIEWGGFFPTTEQVRNFEYGLITQAYACFLACVAPSETILAPRNLTCQRVTNRSLSQLEYIHTLFWQANTANENIVSYRIYRLEDQSKTLLAELGGSFLEFWDRGVDTTRDYVYAVTAVNGDGFEGNPAVVSVASFASDEIEWDKLTTSICISASTTVR